MSKLRPELHSGSGKPCPDTFDSFYMIRDAVRRRDKLIFGKLHDHGESCAIGALFQDNPKLALSTDIVDEVAAYNDSIRNHISERTRKLKVLQWLNAKVRWLQNGAKQ